jgi:hypothetical protein
LATCALVCLAACGGTSTPTIATTFDVCAPVFVDAPGATAEQLGSLDDAIGMWRAHGVTRLTRSGTPDGLHVELRFQHAAANFHGLYDDAAAVIYVNLALTDEHQRAITIAHELGHAFGLAHVAADLRVSVMNPANLTSLPTDADTATLVGLWGLCPAGE